MHLYEFYIGGSAPGANIELHDVQFVVAASPEAAFPLLKARWWGSPDKIHLDGYREVTWADGYDVNLNGKSDTAMKLFFVNAGGYEKGNLAELHAFDFFVAENKEAAKAKALKVLLPNVNLQHKDNLKDVDDCLLLEAVDGIRLGLMKNPNGTPDALLFQGYQPI